DNQTDGRLWLMNRFSSFTEEGYGVTVYEYDAEGRERRRLMSAEAFFSDAEGHWTFVKGRELRFDPSSGDTIYSQVFDRRAYPELTDNPGLMQLLSKRPKDLSLFELREILSKVPAGNNPRMNEYD